MAPRAEKRGARTRSADPADRTILVPVPERESERLRALRGYHVLDTPPELAFDDLTELAALICDAPAALISLVDEDRQWFKSRRGLDLEQTPRDISFCTHAVACPDETLVVPDATRDPRFRVNPLVTGVPGIRFYAGAPIRTDDGLAMGTVCALDYVPRTLDRRQISALEALARQALALLELRKGLAALQASRQRLEEANTLLTKQAITDPLTLLLNRRGLDERLAEELQRARRSGMPLAVFMLDADHFKAFNDAHGHIAGDAVLKELARLLKGGLRPYDAVSRYGGEEYAVVLPGTTAEEAGALAERVRRAIAAHPWPLRRVTASIGVAVLRQGEHGATLLARADDALYRAKRGGRDRVELGRDPDGGAGPAAPDRGGAPSR